MTRMPLHRVDSVRFTPSLLRAGEGREKRVFIRCEVLSSGG